MMAYLRWFVDWPANTNLVMECFESSITGTSLTNLFWKLVEVFYIGVTVDSKAPVLNEMIGEKNLAKSLGLYPWILVALLITAFVTAIVGLFR